MGGGTRIPKVQQAIKTATGRYETSICLNSCDYLWVILSPKINVVWLKESNYDSVWFDSCIWIDSV